MKELVQDILSFFFAVLLFIILYKILIFVAGINL